MGSAPICRRRSYHSAGSELQRARVSEPVLIGSGMSRVEETRRELTRRAVAAVFRGG